MPLAITYQNKYIQAADKRSDSYYKWFEAQLNCCNKLNEYVIEGFGSMPSFSYPIPNSSDVLQFEYGSENIKLNGTSYLDLNTNNKKTVIKYLDRLFKAALDNYDLSYGL